MLDRWPITSWSKDFRCEVLKLTVPRKSKDQTLPISSRESFTWIIPKTILCLVLDSQGVVKLDRYSPVPSKRWLLDWLGPINWAATAPSGDWPGPKKSQVHRIGGTWNWKYTPQKLIWQRNIPFSNRRYIFKWLVFEGIHCLTFPAYIQVGANLIDSICGVIIFFFMILLTWRAFGEEQTFVKIPCIWKLLKPAFFWSPKISKRRWSIAL